MEQDEGLGQKLSGAGSHEQGWRWGPWLRGVEGKGLAQADSAGHTWDVAGRQAVRACLALHGATKAWWHRLG